MTTTVLIVDDDRNVGRSVSMVLARRGMAARIAAPSDWSRALSEEVDVVLLDLYLGAIKGQNILHSPAGGASAGAGRHHVRGRVGGGSGRLRAARRL